MMGGQMDDATFLVSFSNLLTCFSFRQAASSNFDPYHLQHPTNGALDFAGQVVVPLAETGSQRNTRLGSKGWIYMQHGDCKP